MITIKTQKEIDLLREGGKHNAFILKALTDAIHPNISTNDLNTLTLKLLEEKGDKSAFLGYTPEGAPRPYPAAVCISVNDEVVHGIPNEHPRILSMGDIVSIDFGLSHKGMITDAAVTIPVGTIDSESKKLIEVTSAALEAGINAAVGGNRIGDIGFAIESCISPSGFSIVDILAGHGVGYSVHEDPYVPNIGKKGEGHLLKPGMVLAIEPIVNIGNKRVTFNKDGYTVRTADHTRSAHFEHTIIITEGKAEVLTR
ncbi:MAG: type I methionyl aminopeptidase [Patescibacteria group bacterium]